MTLADKKKDAAYEAQVHTVQGSGKHMDKFDEIDDMYGRNWELHADWMAYRDNAVKVRAQKELEERSARISGEEDKKFRDAAGESNKNYASDEI